jgi:hypothetical protein
MRDEVDRLLEGNRAIRFPHKVLLARSLGWITPREAADLEKLNSVRNGCGHSWKISRLIRRGVKRKAPKKPVLRYNGRNVYETKHFIDFIQHFNVAYLRLYMKLEV